MPHSVDSQFNPLHQKEKEFLTAYYKTGGSSLPALDLIVEPLDPRWVGVEAWDKLEFFTTKPEELLFAFHRDFFESFEAICDECGADDFKLFDAFFSEALDFKISVGLKPWIFEKTRLE